MTVSTDGHPITVHIPITFKKRGGRKLVVTPDGADWAPRPRVDNAMVKALARAFRWRKMLDNGVHATLEDLARGEVMFAASGVTTGPMLRGVRRFPGGAVTHSIVMRSRSGTVRYVEGHHNFAVKRPVYAP